jgi:hypothetical protein
MLREQCGPREPLRFASNAGSQCAVFSVGALAAAPAKSTWRRPKYRHRPDFRSAGVSPALLTSPCIEAWASAWRAQRAAPPTKDEPGNAHGLGASLRHSRFYPGKFLTKRAGQDAGATKDESKHRGLTEKAKASSRTPQKRGEAQFGVRRLAAALRTDASSSGEKLGAGSAAHAAHPVTPGEA